MSDKDWMAKGFASLKGEERLEVKAEQVLQQMANAPPLPETTVHDEVFVDEVLDCKGNPIAVGDYVRVAAQPTSMVEGHEIPSYAGFVTALCISAGRVVVEVMDAKTCAHRATLPEYARVTKNRTGRVAGEAPVQAKARRLQKRRGK